MKALAPVVFPAFLALSACTSTSTNRAAPASAVQPASAELPTSRCTLIANVRLFDGEKVIEKTSVVVRDGTIADVNPAPSVRCTETTDGAGKTLLPGLIDSHAHVWDASQLMAATRFGVTTVLDMMTDWKAAAELKKEAATRPELADLRTAGNPVTAPGGHGTEYGLSLQTLTSAADADAFVAARVKEGSDYIKIMYTPDLPLFHSIDRDELQASVAAAHRHQRLAVVHIDTLHEAREALEAGADGLMHLFYDQAADADFVALAKSHHAFVVPTLSVLTSLTPKPHGETLARDPVLSPRLGEVAVRSLKGKFPVHFHSDEAGIQRSVAELHAAGVPILAGTDAANPGTFWGVSLHGELELLVAAGLSPVDALVAATSAPAHAFALADRGRVAPGLRADLLLVDGDPTRDILATRHIVAVWKQGVRLSDDFLAKPPAPAADSAGDGPKVDAPKETAGLISDFETSATQSRFGLGWKDSTDAIMGGKSTVSFARVKADGRAGWSLAVKGNVDGGQPRAWSGVMFHPGEKLWTPADLSAGKEIVFSARGDGQTYSVLLFTKRQGQRPSFQSFVAGKTWEVHHMSFADFDGSDGSDVVGIAFVAGPMPGKYAFQLDDVALK